MTTKRKHVIEVRDNNGNLDPEKEKIKRKEHPYLFSKREFTIDNLCYYMSYGQNRDTPKGTTDLPEFMKNIDITYRVKYW